MNLTQQARKLHSDLLGRVQGKQMVKEAVEELLATIDNVLERGNNSDALMAKNFIRQKLAPPLGITIID